MLRALEDDLCEKAAMDGLLRIGRTAGVALVSAARTFLPSSEEERPSSVRRRTRVLHLLVESGSRIWDSARCRGFANGHYRNHCHERKGRKCRGRISSKVHETQARPFGNPIPDAVERALNDLARTLDGTAEEMQNYALTHTAVCHQLTTSTEAQAAFLGLSRLVGSRRMVSAWRVD